MVIAAPIPQRALEVLEKIPQGFVDDGCSNYPDRWLVLLARMRVTKLYDLRFICRIHDWRFCSRCHPPGEMSFAHEIEANAEMRDLMREYLPRPLDWTASLVFRVLNVAGGMGAWDSCGPQPFGATAGQIAQGLCRHGMPKPEWM